MSAVAAAQPSGFGLAGWLRIVVRLSCMTGLLVVATTLHGLWRALRRPSPWPRLFLAGVAWVAGVELRVSGEHERRGRFLLANHVSWLDIPILAGLTGTSFVGHEGLAAHPFLRWLCGMNATVFIARHDRARVAEQVEQVRSALSETGALTIFPEGTTSDGTGLLPFKSALLSALEPLPEGIAIQPVVLDYGPDAAVMAWFGAEHGLDNLKRVLARSRPLPVRVTFLPPLHGEALAGRKAMANAARAAMLSELGRT